MIGAYLVEFDPFGATTKYPQDFDVPQAFLAVDAVLVLFVVPGALLGRALAHRINQALFDQLVLAATVVGGVQLLLLG